MNGSMVKKNHIIKNGIRIQCNTENFVPIVVLGLSTSSSSSLPSSTSMTPSRQEIDHATSSSSTSSSPTRTSSTVSSDSVIGQARGDLCGIDSYPVSVSSKHVERNGVTCQIPTYRNGCKNSEKISWMIEFLNTETLTPVLLMKYLQSPHPREVWIRVSTVFILISLETEIARSVRGPKLPGPSAEDAMAEPYLALKILVT